MGVSIFLYFYVSYFGFLGPGCSSIGFGEAVELGPLRVQKFGTGLEFNNHAWNKGYLIFSYPLVCKYTP